MAALAEFQEVTKALHSETISVIRRQIDGKPFDIAVTNGRTRVWAERFHEIEPEFLSWCDTLTSSDVLWDIGASIGHFAVYSALTTGARVFAFEPEAQNFSHCALNHFLNYAHLGGRLTPINCGIAAHSQLSNLYIQLYGAGEHTKSLVHRDNSYSTKIMLLSVQDIRALGVASPSAVKIDVDGAEKTVVPAMDPLWPGVDNVFIEIRKDDRRFFHDLFSDRGLRLTSEYPVVKMGGGYYPDIVNATFARGG